jgi:hypothetical protein
MMIEFGNDDVADHAETGLAPRNGLLRRWRPHNRFARPAGELRPNVAHDLEDDGLDIERLIGVLAETAKSAATSRTNAIAACRQVNDLLARKMGRHCAIWRFPLVADRCGARWQFGLRRLQFLKRQFELSDLRRQLLR